MSDFQITGRGKYTTRDGRLAAVDQDGGGNLTYRYAGSVGADRETWSAKGLVLEDLECDSDIVAKWTDPEPPKPVQAEQVKQEPGSKFDAGKTRLDLIAPEFLLQTADVLAFGAKKYGDRNWEAGMSWSRCYAALQRHMIAFWSGQDTDEETGLPHLAHAACCLMFLMAFQSRSGGTDDRAKLL